MRLRHVSSLAPLVVGVSLSVACSGAAPVARSPGKAAPMAPPGRSSSAPAPGLPATSSPPPAVDPTPVPVATIPGGGTAPTGSPPASSPRTSSSPASSPPREVQASYSDATWRLERLEVGSAPDGTWQAMAVVRNRSGGVASASFQLDVVRAGKVLATLVGQRPATRPGRSGDVVLLTRTRFTSGASRYAFSTGGGGF